MEQIINISNKRYIFSNEIKNSDSKRNGFIALAEKVFDLSFDSWYKNGYWTDKYCPYTLFDGEKAVANVSASKIHTIVDGEPKLYIQLGTVMTHPDYRNLGLSNTLIGKIFEHFRDNY